MRFTSLTIAIFIVLTANVVGATKLARISVSEMYSQATRVALVQITSAKMSDTGSGCGIFYRASVLEPLKNTVAGKELALHSRYDAPGGLRTGQRFLVFLNERAEGSPCKTCSLEVAHAGYGALWVGSPYRVNLDLAVQVPASYVALPPTLHTRGGQSSDRGTSETTWVDKAKLFNFLSKLSKSQNP